MIFEEHLIKFILTGKTTTTIMPPRPNGDPPCRLGRTYILQKRIPQLTDDDGTIIRPTQIRSTSHRLLITGVHPTTDGWNITFTLDRTAPLHLLHRRSERGYTTRIADGLPHEGESPHPSELAQYAKQGHANYRLHHHQDVLRAEADTLAKRLRKRTLEATRAGLDITPDIAAINDRLAAIERKLKAA